MTGNPEQLKRVKDHARPDIVFALAKPDDQHWLVASSDAKLHLLNAEDPKQEPQVFQAAHTGFVLGLAMAADGQAISGAYDKKLIWWDIESGEPTRTIDAHQKWIRDVTVTPDGAKVISVADDMVCRVWNANDGKLIHELRGHAERTPTHFPSMLFAAAVSPDGKLAATADKLGKAVIWDLESGKQLAELEAPEMYTWDPRQRIHSIGGIRALAFTPDGKQLALGGINRIGNIDHLGALARVEVFDWQKQERTHEFKGDGSKGIVERLIFGPDAKWLCAAGGDNGGFIQFLDMEKTKVLKQDKAPMHVHDALFNEDFTQLDLVGHQKLATYSL